MNIRDAKLEDAQQVADVYNYYVQKTHHTFETEPLINIAGKFINARIFISKGS